MGTHGSEVWAGALLLLFLLVAAALLLPPAFATHGAEWVEVLAMTR